MHTDRTDDTPFVIFAGPDLADARRLVTDAVFLKASMISPDTHGRDLLADVEDLAECAALALSLGGAPFETPSETDGALTRRQARTLRRLARAQAKQAEDFLEDRLTDQARRKVEGLRARSERVRVALKAGAER